MKNNQLLENSILILSRLQGIGPRSAKRILFNLLNNNEGLLIPLINSLQNLSDNIVECSKCFNIDTSNPCQICLSDTREQHIICVVEDIASLWAIEQSNSFNGLYFILKGNLSASKNVSPDNLNINKLITRIEQEKMKEVILAISSTVEGQITANYIAEKINNPEVKVSVLAQGIPVGGEIDYLDDITLATAIKSRKSL